jgi:signal transduction histidine kinase
MVRTAREISHPLPGGHADLPSVPQSPLRVFALVLLLVFSAEGAIMLLLPALPEGWHGTLVESLVDAGALTLVTAPAVWLLAVAPLRRLFEARGRLLRRLFESQEQERARIARDLHDGVGQNLTALLVGLRTIEDAGDVATAGARARELRELASAAHGEVRRLARGLRPVALEELGLVPAVERLCEDFQRTHGVEVTLRLDPPLAARLDPGAETALYRIVQEGLANVARHARARAVELLFRKDGEGLLLALRDDGRGFDAADLEALEGREGSFGLGSMRERALMLGGECAVRSRRGEGTSVEIRIPLERAS